MTEQTGFDLDLIERVFPILMRHLRERAGGDVHIANDYYWSVPADEIHDVANAPGTLAIGQVSECIEWLRAVDADPDRALTYHLVYLADALGALGRSQSG